MNLVMEPELIRRSAMTTPSSELERPERRAIKVETTPASNTAGVRAPWWMALELASTNGAGVEEVATAYANLVDVVDQLEQDEDEPVTMEVAASARVVLDRLATSRIVAPKISWHAEGVVLIWTWGKSRMFYTITAGEISCMLEASGRVIRRTPEMPIQDWVNAPLR